MFVGRESVIRAVEEKHGVIGRWHWWGWPALGKLLP